MIKVTNVARARWELRGTLITALLVCLLESVKLCLVTRRPEISKTTIQVWFFLTSHVCLGLAAALPHTVNHGTQPHCAASVWDIARLIGIEKDRDDKLLAGC